MPARTEPEDDESAPMMESMPTIYAKDTPQPQRRCARRCEPHCCLATVAALGVTWLLIAALVGPAASSEPLGHAGSCPSESFNEDITQASSLTGEAIP